MLVAIYLASGYAHILKWVDNFFVIALPGDTWTEADFTSLTQVPKLLCCITDMSTRVDNVVWYMEQQTQLKRIQCHNCIGSAEGHVDTLVYT